MNTDKVKTTDDIEQLLKKIDDLKAKLSKCRKGCKKLREENKALKIKNKTLEENMGNLLCTREEEIKYNRTLNENLMKAAEINALIAGKLSVYENLKRGNLE